MYQVFLADFLLKIGIFRNLFASDYFPCDYLSKCDYFCCDYYEWGQYLIQFRFNSIQAPAIYGYENCSKETKFVEYKSRETLDETLSFWGHKYPKSL